MFCRYCGNSIKNEDKFCPYCGNNTMFSVNNINMPIQQIQHSMKWYKFLIYVQLFLGALINISSLGSVIGSKLIYEENKEQISELADSKNYYTELLDMLEGMDIFLNICVILAVCSALMVIMAIIVRQKLAHYRKEGPKLLLIYYGLNLVINIAISLAAYICVPKEIWESANYNLSQNYLFIITGIIMIICNKIYFKNREYMFVN